MEIESLRRKNGKALYKTSPKSDVEPQKSVDALKLERIQPDSVLLTSTWLFFIILVK